MKITLEGTSKELKNFIEGDEEYFNFVKPDVIYKDTKESTTSKPKPPQGGSGIPSKEDYEKIINKYFFQD